MILFYGVMMWVNAWLCDRSFRKGRIAWGLLCGAVAVVCFVQWLQGLS